MAPPTKPITSSLGELYSRCVQLSNENKISAKNAFDLPLIDHMDDIVDAFMGARKGKSSSFAAASSSSSAARRVSAEEEAEHRFHEASCTIEASARIYACRVDCVHTDTYRVLGGLNAHEVPDGEDEGEGEGQEGRPVKRRRLCGVNTLEKNPANLLQPSIEADEQSDPMFRRMAAAFDAGGAKGLLLSQLPIAEDLSLLFNADVPVTKAKEAARAIFTEPLRLAPKQLGLGEPDVALARLAECRPNPEIDRFRVLAWGEGAVADGLPEELEAILRAAAGPAPAPPPATQLAVPSQLAPTQLAVPRPAPPSPGGASDACCPGDLAPDAGSPTALAPLGPDDLLDQAPLPLQDDLAAQQAQLQLVPAEKNEDVIAFDDLFRKFCSSTGSNQYAYFDECWSRKPRDREGKGAGSAAAEAALASVADVGALEAREKASKRPLFDPVALEKPPKPIETEPVHKHQLSERAAAWQLHRDVPPYMIDRITMPNWQTWSKSDFACLGLRPHLMLRLVRKPQPSGEGPHRFSDLFSTVVVENPDYLPGLGRGARGSMGAVPRDDRDGDEDARAERDADGPDDDFDGRGLPPHLDVDPQDLFLKPDDKVVPGADGQGPAEGYGHDDESAAVLAGLDFDLVEQPLTVGCTDIAYSRNSKFVDVKLVKQKLWDCIQEDVEAATEPPKSRGLAAASSFQDLMTRTVERLPKSEIANLSAAVCFICALHLCNEKGLEIRTDGARPMGDFQVLAPAA